MSEGRKRLFRNRFSTAKCHMPVGSRPPVSPPSPLAHTAPALRGHSLHAWERDGAQRGPKTWGTPCLLQRPNRKAHGFFSNPSNCQCSTCSWRWVTGEGGVGGWEGVQRANKELSPCHHRPVTLPPAPCHRATSPGGGRPTLSLQPSSPGFRGAAQ